MSIADVFIGFLLASSAATWLYSWVTRIRPGSYKLQSTEETGSTTVYVMSAEEAEREGFK